MDINLLVNRDKLNIGDLIAMEEGSLRASRDIIASCLTDDKNEYLSKEDAIEVINKLNANEFNKMAEQFMDELKALPLASKTRS